MAQTTLSAALLSQVAAIVAPAADKLGVNDLSTLVNNVGNSLLGFAERAHLIETDRVGVGAAATSVAALNAGQPSGGDVWDEPLPEETRQDESEPAAVLPPEPRRQEPAHPIQDTVHPDYIISLEDGKPYRVLTRHLKKLNMTPEEYRKKWGLSGNYPMVAPNFTIRRREIAVEMGFGKRKGGRTAQAAGAAAANNELPPATQEAVIDGALAASLEAQGEKNEYVGGEQPALPLDQVQASGGETGGTTNTGEAAKGEGTTGEVKTDETPKAAPAPRAKKTTSSRAAAAKVEPKAATKTEPKKATGKGGGRRKAAA